MNNNCFLISPSRHKVIIHQLAKYIKKNSCKTCSFFRTFLQCTGIFFVIFVAMGRYILCYIRSHGQVYSLLHSRPWAGKFFITFAAFLCRSQFICIFFAALVQCPHEIRIYQKRKKSNKTYIFREKA